MSKTLIDSVTLSRLVAVAGALAKLYDNGWIRDTGETVFREARGELDDVIKNAVEPVTAAPVQVIQAMPVDAVEALVDAAVQRVEAAKADTVDALVVAVRGELEGSDVVVLDAIAETRGALDAARTELLAAIEATEAAAATTTE